MNTLHLDVETRSAVDLKKTGTYVYAEDPTTDLWCAAYAVNDEPVRLWTPGGPVPGPVVDAVLEDWPVVAHNAAFERVIWRYILGPRYGWPEPRVEQWRCTMAMAFAMALPGSLENAAAALGLSVGKDMAGHRLMMQMAKPRKKDPLTWWDVDEKKERLYAYCKQDVEVERQLEKRLLPLSKTELALWHLDQKINDRGVYVDEPLCHAALDIVDVTKERLDKQIAAVSGLEITGVSNVRQIIGYCRERGIDVDSIAKDQLAELLARDDLAPDVRKVLELRDSGRRASVAKVNALLTGKSADGRAKGLMQYHAATTGRWGGRRFQPQNIKRPDVKDVDSLIDATMKRDPDLIELLYGDPLAAIGDTLRGMVRSAPGNIFYCADYSNIEGRVLAWLAGEEWKLQAFRDYDAGTGHDLYKLAYSKSFGKPVKQVDSNDRQIGKVQELALGFEGGHGAFLTMGANYGIDPKEIAKAVKPITSESTWDWAVERYDSSSGMDVDSWAALRVLIDAWRDAHANVRQFWYDLEEASIAAVRNPGETYSVGMIRYKVSGSFLFCQLPSKRALVYPYPKIVDKKMPWGETKKALRHKTMDSFTRKWGDRDVYGGLLAENVTQAAARDVLAEALPRLEEAGYPVILTVHDEALAERKAGTGDLQEFEKLMAALPAWASGLPVSVEGWTGERYRK